MDPIARLAALALGPFLAELDKALHDLSAEELRTAVVDLARSMPPKDRPALLAHFGGNTASPTHEWTALSGAIEALEEQAATDGEPGWDEDDEWHDRYGWSAGSEEAVPDWAPSWHDVLARTDRLFLAGDMARSAEAYGRLFQVAVEAAEQGWSLVGGADEGDVLDEAAARYLRSTSEAGEATGRRQRMGDAVTAVDQSLIASRGLSLAAVADAGPTPLDDGERFLADWIDALRPLYDDDTHSGEPWPQRLLIEAVATLQGARGLAELARNGGPHSGRAHLAWFDVARDKGDLEDAKRAAVEGMAAPTGTSDRAALAERLAALGEQIGDHAMVVEARRDAWTSLPTLERLLAAVQAARRAGVEAETLAALADDARSATPSSSPRLTLASRAAVLVLAGRLDDAIAVAEAPASPSPGRGWSSRADEVVVPALLVAATDATHHQRFDALVLASLLGRTDDRVGLARPHWLGADPYDTDQASAPSPSITLGDLLVDAIGQLTLGAEERQALFAHGARASAAAVAAIVEPKDRRRYPAAGEYAIAYAEAVALLRGSAAGERAADEAAARYPRHSAYQRELTRARQRCPLLDPPR